VVSGQLQVPAAPVPIDKDCLKVLDKTEIFALTGIQTSDHLER